MSANKTCIYCLEEIGLLATHYKVKKSVKPKGAYKRWKDIGIACKTCVECQGLTTMIEDVK